MRRKVKKLNERRVKLTHRAGQVILTLYCLPSKDQMRPMRKKEEKLAKVILMATGLAMLDCAAALSLASMAVNAEY